MAAVEGKEAQAVKDAMVSLKALTGGYGGEPVLRGLTLDFPRREITALVGPNGCGKSTLLRFCARLLEPDSGEITLDGRSLGAIPRRELARLVSILPQGRPVSGIPVYSLVSHGRFPYLGYPRRMSREDRDKVEEAMALAGVEEYRDRPVSELSGGQRQRVYFAMALAQDTPLVLLDEPATYLDLNHQLELMELIRLLRDRGKTVVAVLHDLPQAMEWADRLVVLEEGRLAGEGPPGEVFRQGILDRVFGLTGQQVAVGGVERYFFSRALGVAEVVPGPPGGGL